eukprot:UN4257
MGPPDSQHARLLAMQARGPLLDKHVRVRHGAVLFTVPKARGFIGKAIKAMPVAAGHPTVPKCRGSSAKQSMPRQSPPFTQLYQMPGCSGEAVNAMLHAVHALGPPTRDPRPVIKPDRATPETSKGVPEAMLSENGRASTGEPRAGTSAGHGPEKKCAHEHTAPAWNTCPPTAYSDMVTFTRF